MSIDVKKAVLLFGVGEAGSSLGDSCSSTPI